MGASPRKPGDTASGFDREKYTVEVPEMTGRQILELAKKLPPENWLLNQKLKGGHVKAIGLTEVVDFRTPGIERFMTLPKDQNEGLSTPRRQFQLPEADVEGLDAAGFQWETIGAGGGWLLVHGYDLPGGYNVNAASVAVQIPGGYPDDPLRHGLFQPGSKPTGRAADPGPTQAIVQIDGTNWQRWSRHYSPVHPWIPGEYNVITHLALARHWLERELQRN